MKPHIPGGTSLPSEDEHASPGRHESMHAPRSDSSSWSHVIMNHLETTPFDLPGVRATVLSVH